MNAIVVIALKRPYTFVVLAILIVLYGVLAVLKTPTDIFPNIKIPVVAVVWSYSGLSPEDMSGRVIYYYERQLTTTVSNIEHIESQSLYGRGIVKIFFQPGTDIAAAQAQIASISQTVLKQMPAGITPPSILIYSASSVPVLDLQVADPNMTATQLYDIASNFIRPALVSVPGVAIPAPYGGASKYVEIDLNQSELLAHGLSAEDVAVALKNQNIVLPAGDMKIGALDYFVSTNASPINIDTFDTLPIRQVGDAVVTLGDVAHVYFGGPPQTNMVLVKGRQAVLIEILKSGDASTLSVVDGVKKMLPQLIKTLPAGITITPLSDASKFVRASVFDVVQEMVTAAILTGFAVLLFIGSWRSTLIVATSIPLAILSSILMLSWLGQTINVMTLGGLALAVGILVDHSIVMIENIDTHIEYGKGLEDAIIDAANQIIVPTFVATLCICIVFLPLFQLSGISGYLFLPLGEAIIFAMIASFILSRTLVPTMANYLLRGQVSHHEEGGSHGKSNVFTRFQRGFDRGFTRFRESYRSLLTESVDRRGLVITVFVCGSLVSLLLVGVLGENFFPQIKSGEIDMHMRAPIGTRIEEAGKIAVLVNGAIRQVLPGQVDNIIDNCGLPVSGINEAYNATGTIGPQDCDIDVTLQNEESPVQTYTDRLRRELPSMFPGTEFTFLPGDITAKILNFGLPAPIDVQIKGRHQAANLAYAQTMVARLRSIPGIADVHVQQAYNSPTLRINTSRTFAVGTGLTEANVAGDALTTLSGSGQTAPTFWLDVTNGVSRLVNMQTPQSELSSVGQLENIPVDKGDGDPTGTATQILGALGTITQTGSPQLVSHYDILPVIDIYATNQRRDLGTVNDAVERVVHQMAAKVPHGSTVEVQGQARTMQSAYTQLVGGLVMAVLLIFLVIVVNFQSWLDPFIIITALPTALAGIAWSLFITDTTLSVPALTGALMCMGVATANSILVVAFARERLAIHGDAARAAIEAGYGRLRPVLMTASAMIVGMVPMSISNTQNAPLGRAVMGGLMVATFATLLLVPCVFAMLHGRQKSPAGVKA
jgi:multidrug efflux pump subunit AcrB